MDWEEILAKTTKDVPVESGMLGNVEWKHYANGLLTFFGQGAIIDFMYELTYPGYHDEDHTEYYPLWSSWLGKRTDAPVKYVYIDEGITEIGDRAFEGCLISEICIPNTVTERGIYIIKLSMMYCIHLI